LRSHDCLADTPAKPARPPRQDRALGRDSMETGCALHLQIACLSLGFARAKAADSRAFANSEKPAGPGYGYRGPAVVEGMSCELCGRLAPSTRPSSRSPQIRPCRNGSRRSVAAVAEAVPLRVQHRTDGGDRHHERTLAVEENEELCHSSSSPPSPLEPEVLQRLGCAPVEHRSLAIVATASSKIALRNPRRSPMGA